MHRNIVALGFTSLFTDVSTEMLIPVLPLFITATLGASATGLGLIEGVAECVASLLRTASGWLSDRIGRRKPFLVLGYGLSGAAKAAIGLATTWPAVLALRAADRLGKGLRNPPRDALIADSVPPAALGRAFGLHRGMDTLGAAIGPLVSWWLLARWHALGVEGYRRLFFVSAIPAALSLLVLLVFVRAPRHTPAPPRPLIGRTGALGGAFARFVAVDAVFQLGNSSNAFVLLRTQGAGWSASQVALIYVAYNIVLAALSWPFGSLSDRIGRRPLLLAGYLMYALTYGLFALHATRGGVVVAFLLLAVQTALIDGQARSLVARLVPRETRATAFGVQATVVGLSLLPASLAAGWLWDHRGPRVALGVDAGLALLAAALFPLLLPAGRETAA
ncbi:MAG: MFS transporter [Candidatus Eisenbacteria bacterium]